MSGFLTTVTGGLGGLGILGCTFALPAPTPAPLPNPLGTAAPPPPFFVPFVCIECTDEGVAALIGKVPGEDADSGDDERSRSRKAVEDSRSREGTLDCELEGMERKWF